MMPLSNLKKLTVLLNKRRMKKEDEEAIDNVPLARNSIGI